MQNIDNHETKTSAGSSLQEHQAMLEKLLYAFSDVCEQNNIPFQLYAGTLLGAVRHHGFIPWDDDIDVVMSRDAYDRFLQVAPKALNPDIFFLQGEYSEHWPMFFSKLRLNHTACMEKFIPKDPMMHQGIYIDIFPYDNLSNNSFRRKLQFYASKIVIAKGLHLRGLATDSILKKAVMQMSALFPPLIIRGIHEYVLNRSQPRTEMVPHCEASRRHPVVPPGGNSVPDSDGYPCGRHRLQGLWKPLLCSIPHGTKRSGIQAHQAAIHEKGRRPVGRYAGRAAAPGLSEGVQTG